MAVAKLVQSLQGHDSLAEHVRRVIDSLLHNLYLVHQIVHRIASVSHENFTVAGAEFEAQHDWEADVLVRGSDHE